MDESGAAVPEATTQTQNVTMTQFTYSCAASGARVTIQDVGGGVIANHRFQPGLNQQLTVNAPNAVLINVNLTNQAGKQVQYHAPYSQGIQTASYTDDGTLIAVGYALASMQPSDAAAKVRPNGPGAREPGAPEPIPFGGVDYTDPDSGAEATAWAQQGPQQGHIQPGTNESWQPGGTDVGGLSIEQTDGGENGQWVSYDCPSGEYIHAFVYACDQSAGSIELTPTLQRP